tara:strand:+ start:128 stop:301 length:174 start_codon:yes stop_codon:yes gene_type:complete
MSKAHYVPVVATASDAPADVDSATRKLALVVSVLSCTVSVAAIVFVVRSLTNAGGSQ